MVLKVFSKNRKIYETKSYIILSPEFFIHLLLEMIHIRFTDGICTLIFGLNYIIISTLKSTCYATLWNRDCRSKRQTKIIYIFCSILFCLEIKIMITLKTKTKIWTNQSYKNLNQNTFFSIPYLILDSSVRSHHDSFRPLFRPLYLIHRFQDRP